MKIKMKQSDAVWTDKGPVSLQAEQEYEVGFQIPAPVAATLVGRGFAVYVEAPAVHKYTSERLAELKTDELKAIAKDFGIKGFGNMKTSNLIEKILSAQS